MIPGCASDHSSGFRADWKIGEGVVADEQVVVGLEPPLGDGPRAVRDSRRRPAQRPVHAFAGPLDREPHGDEWLPPPVMQVSREEIEGVSAAHVRLLPSARIAVPSRPTESGSNGHHAVHCWPISWITNNLCGKDENGEAHGTRKEKAGSGCLSLCRDFRRCAPPRAGPRSPTRCAPGWLPPRRSAR